jgi:RNA polymerase sigma-70 factor (ECF subfamily)
MEVFAERGGVLTELEWPAPPRERRHAMATDTDSSLLEQALAGNQAALSRLVERLTPVIQARVARSLLRTGRGAGPRLRQEMKDLVQQVFLALFDDGGRILAGWDASRGLSLDNFVGLVAERQVISILRSGKRDPWKEDPTLVEEMDGPSPEADPEEAAASREELERLLERLRQTLSPLGWQLFDLLYLQDRSVKEVEDATGLSADAVYAWRSRLRRLARSLLGERVSERAPRERMTKGEA